MSSSALDSGLGQIGVDTARHYADLIVNDYPDPGDKFRRQDLDNHSAKRHLHVLEERNVIDVVGRDENCLLYAVDERAVTVAQAAIDNRDPMLPCGHSGMINLRDGRGFVCSYWRCDEIHDREEIKAWRDQ